MVTVPLVPTPRCTSDPTCEERGLSPTCFYCKLRAGEFTWLTQTPASPTNGVHKNGASNGVRVRRVTKKQAA